MKFLKIFKENKLKFFSNLSLLTSIVLLILTSSILTMLEIISIGELFSFIIIPALVFLSILEKFIKTKILFLILLAAFFLRLSVGISLYSFAMQENSKLSLFQKDDRHFFEFGGIIADYWHEDGEFYIPGSIEAGYYYYNALIQFFLGKDIRFVIIVNIIFGILSIFFVYKISLFYFKEKWALVSALIMSVLPEQIFFSSYNQKEIFITFLLILFVFLILRFFEKEKNNKNNFFLFESLIILSLVFLRFFQGFGMYLVGIFYLGIIKFKKISLTKMSFFILLPLFGYVLFSPYFIKNINRLNFFMYINSVDNMRSKLIHRSSEDKGSDINEINRYNKELIGRRKSGILKGRIKERKSFEENFIKSSRGIEEERKSEIFEGKVKKEKSFAKDLIRNSKGIKGRIKLIHKTMILSLLWGGLHKWDSSIERNILKTGTLLIWYPLMFPLLLGFWQIFRSGKLLEYSLIILVPLLILFSSSVSYLGLIYRYRVSALPFLIIIIVVGIKKIKVHFFKYFSLMFFYLITVQLNLIFFPKNWILNSSLILIVVVSTILIFFKQKMFLKK